MKRLLNRIQKIYHEYPRAFWIYNIIIFIDRLGGFMLYPFFALYLTQKYNIGMSTVGLIFAIFSVSGFVGSALGGALTDRMGRRGVIIFESAEGRPGTMMAPVEVAASTRRRQRCGYWRACDSTVIPPIECPTSTTGPLGAVAASTLSRSRPNCSIV